MYRKSGQIRLGELRRMFRILGDARDLRFDPAAQQRRIVDGVNELLDGHVGFAIGFRNFVSPAAIVMDGWVPGSDCDSRLASYLHVWSQHHEMWEDPMVCLAGGQGGAVLATARSRLISYRDWTRYSIFEELVDPTDLQDILITHFRRREPGRVQGFSWHRLKPRPDYDHRDLHLARIFMVELYRLYCAGQLEPPHPYHDLPPRLRQLASLLAGDAGQKQIAERMGLSYHTVRSYTRDLYHRFEVSSREELAARMRGFSA